MKAFAVVVFVVSSLSVSVANAQAAGDPSPDASISARVERWYGWETLLTDAAGISAMIAAGESRPGAAEPLVVLGLATYALGGPIVHAAEGHPREAGLSFGLRLGAPFVGGLSGFLLGEAMCQKDDGEVPCPAVTGTLGFLGGAVAAIAIDASILAREPESSKTSASLLVPTVSISKSGVGAGLTGQF